MRANQSEVQRFWIAQRQHGLQRGVAQPKPAPHKQTQINTEQTMAESRVADPGDGRSLLVTLTDEGIEKARAAITEDMATETELLDGLSEHEQKTLARLLRKLALSLEARGL